jgi:hypothetical protein
VTLLTGEDLDEIFSGFNATADHLEVRDRYRDEVEDEALRRWLAGEPDDLAWMDPWLDQVRSLTAAGKRMRRVRVVSVPLSDYQRWALERVCQLNIDAGEDIRYLDRANAGGVPEFDFWLFDDGEPGAHAVEVRFDEGDEFIGGQVLASARVRELSEGFQRAFERAVPAQVFAEAHSLR